MGYLEIFFYREPVLFVRIVVAQYYLVLLTNCYLVTGLHACKRMDAVCITIRPFIPSVNPVSVSIHLLRQTSNIKSFFKIIGTRDFFYEYVIVLQSPHGAAPLSVILPERSIILQNSGLKAIVDNVITEHRDITSQFSQGECVCCVMGNRVADQKLHDLFVSSFYLLNRPYIFLVEYCQIVLLKKLKNRNNRKPK